MTGRARWKQEDEATVARMWLAGKSVNEIAAVLGRTVAATTRCVSRLRQQGHNLPRRIRGHQYRELAEKLLRVLDVPRYTPDIAKRAGCTTTQARGALKRLAGNRRAEVRRRKDGKWERWS